MKNVEDRSKQTAPELLIEAFVEKLPENGKVLDVGCGTGYVSKVLSKKGFEVVSIDPKDERIEEGRRMDRFQKVVNSTLREADLPESSFDGAVAIEVIEHVESPKKFLAELRRVLDPEGVLAIKTPNRVTHDLYQLFFERQFQLLLGRKLDFHPNVMTSRQLVEEMEENGFDVKLLKPVELPENQERKLGGFSKLLQPFNFRVFPNFLQPTLMAIGERR